MDNKIFVLKFGGSSVSKRGSWQKIDSIIKMRLKEGVGLVVVVCSAASGVTNLLEQVLQDIEGGKDYSEGLAKIKHLYQSLAQELDVKVGVSELFSTLERSLLGAQLVGEVTPRLQAKVLAQGELILTQLGETFLRQQGLSCQWLDARKVLISQGENLAAEGPLWRNYLAATCPYTPVPSLQEEFLSLKVPVIITQGFIAANNQGDTVLLGRGGSDTSAAYFAGKLQAKRLEIWTDVLGLYTANPNLIPQARLLKKLDYLEAQELASAGAKVLHPNCLPPVQEQSIPLHIYNTQWPTKEGTVIGGGREQQLTEGEWGPHGVKSICCKKGITLISLNNSRMWHEVGFLADLFAHFKRHKLSIDLLSTSETNVTVTLDPQENALKGEVLSALTRDLSTLGTVEIISPVAVISLVGQGVRTALPQLSSALTIFQEQKLYLMTQSSLDLNLSFVVDEEHLLRPMERLHSVLFGHFSHDQIEGEIKASKWWVAKKKELLKYAQTQTPLYVYDQATLSFAAQQLKEIAAIDGLFYAMKANSHPQVLQNFYQEGLGIECVSQGEVNFLKSLIPDLDPRRVLFTPNFAPLSEYLAALEEGLWVTVDNLFILEQWGKHFSGKEIFLRLDPGLGKGHHKYVRTAGEQSKFGMTLTEMPKVLQQIKAHGIIVRGLHAHSGSGIQGSDHWKELALQLISWLPKFPDVKIINVGGGLNVPMRPEEKDLDLTELSQQLASVKKLLGKVQLWVEPGRFLVAGAGIILAKVTQLKTKGKTHYVGLDAGMNALIRPALYGSYHPIYNFSQWENPPKRQVQVVGPICESGDTLGHDRFLPESKVGDIFLIDMAGAYGKVMSSKYNLRGEINEIFLQ